MLRGKKEIWGIVGIKIQRGIWEIRNGGKEGIFLQTDVLRTLFLFSGDHVGIPSR